jgi:polyphosphate kinase
MNMPPFSDDPKDIFIHRDLSWLSFNERVLEEAEDRSNPLLERTKFLAIFMNNLDEFYMVRVAGLKRLLDSGFNKKDKFGYFPQDLMDEVALRTAELVKRLYNAYDNILKELKKNKINIKKFDELSDSQKRYAKKYFDATIFPIVTPIAVDQGHPFPVLPSKTLAFAVSLTRYDREFFAILTVPKNVPRAIRLPEDGSEDSFILIECLLRENIEKFFRGYKIAGTGLFRIIRDSELTVEEEYEADLLKAIENEVKNRPRAKAVHIEAEKNCPPEILRLLCDGVNFPKENITLVGGDLDLTYLFGIGGMVSRPELFYKSFVPAKIHYENIFDRMKESNFIIHLPYEDFAPTADLIKTAAGDENVLAIKMTLYRTNEDSAIIAALKQAAKNNKQVTVLVEIKARFDEERNINWVRELEDSGCHVMYGIPGMKIHSKISLIVRKEEGKICRYVHLSTGNYNEKTSRLYTDIGYFTANDDFANDISDVFNVITGYSIPSRWKRIVSSPYDLRQYFADLIDAEIENQKNSGNGLIFAKMNSLEDTKIIEKLYEASSTGVKIRLIVRGICSLRPGVKGLSENIEVRSIVGRLLEHSRIFLFNNDASPRVFLSSADWMSRNLDRRIELLFELYKQDMKNDMAQVLESCWKDNVKARALHPDKQYLRVDPGADAFNVQEEFILKYSK